MTLAEVLGSGGVPPLTPAQARKRAARIEKARAAAQDVRNANAARIATATRKVAAAQTT